MSSFADHRAWASEMTPLASITCALAPRQRNYSARTLPPRASGFLVRVFADGLCKWRAELLAFFDRRATMDHAEGVIHQVKAIKCRDYGLLTFDGFLERILLAAASAKHPA